VDFVMKSLVALPVQRPSFPENRLRHLSRHALMFTLGPGLYDRR